MRRERILALCAVLASLPAGAQTAAGEAPLVALVDRTVTLGGGTPVAVADRLSLPADVDAAAGLVSLVWEESGARLLLEGVRARIRKTDGAGVRLQLGDVRIDLPAGQGLSAKQRPEKTPRVFLGAPPENAAALTFAACQTTVRLLPGATASVLIDRNGGEASIQGEGGVVEVIDREGSTRRVHAGELLLDRCVLPPGRLSVEPPETRSAITPYEP